MINKSNYRFGCAPLVEVDNRAKPSEVDPSYFASFSKDMPDAYIFGDEVTHFSYLNHAWHLTMNLSAHDFELPFSKRLFYNRPKLVVHPLGAAILFFITSVAYMLETAYPHHRLSPQVGELLALAKAFKPKCPPEDVKFVADADIDTLVAEYNALALKMRQALRDKGMGERVKSFRRNATRNYNHLMRVIRANHERNQRILLIRLEWSEKPVDAWAPIERVSQEEFDAGALRQAEARDKMVRHLKRHFKANLLFYAWKIEWGVKKRFHMHWLIGLNGSVYQDRINVPYHIAKHWDEVLFGGASHTHNVNAMSGKEQAGLRVLHYADSQAGSAFGLFADYLTKVDYNLKLRLPRGMRSFGCSKLNKVLVRKSGPARAYPMADYDFSDVRGKRGRATGRRFSVKTLSKGL